MAGELRTRQHRDDQQPRVRSLGEILGDAMVAAALIDRLVRHASMVTLKSKSYRLRERGDRPASRARPGRKLTPQPSAPGASHSARLRLAAREAAANPQVAQVPTGAWCTFRFLKLAHCSAPVDTPGHCTPRWPSS